MLCFSVLLLYQHLLFTMDTNLKVCLVAKKESITSNHIIHFDCSSFFLLVSCHNWLDTLILPKRKKNEITLTVSNDWCYLFIVSYFTRVFLHFFSEWQRLVSFGIGDDFLFIFSIPAIWARFLLYGRRVGAFAHLHIWRVLMRPKWYFALFWVSVERAHK